MEENKELTETTNAKKDDAMDLQSLMRTSRNDAVIPTIVNDKKEEPEFIMKEAQQEDSLTPLEKAMKAKQEGNHGLLLNNKEIKKENTPLRSFIDTEEREQDANESLDSLDKLIKGAKGVKVIRKPENPGEMAQLIDEVEAVAEAKAGRGDTSILTDPEKLKKRMTIDVVEEGSSTGTETETASKNTNNQSNNEDEKTTDSNETEKEPNTEETSNNELINVLIDKTGLGNDFMFSDQEKEKLFHANEIRVTEVEDVTLSSIIYEKPTKSFMEEISQYELSISKTPMSFPASRFSASMVGLSYGELGDISINPENTTFDKLMKQFSVIYDKMINPTCGKFKSFEDFLKNFAYIDKDLAIFGMVVSTFQEVDTISLRCNNDVCGKSFNHKYIPRALIRFEDFDQTMLRVMDELVDVNGSKAIKLLEESPMRKRRRYKLPFSKYIVEVGLASAWEYIYDIADNVLGDKFQEEHPDDVNNVRRLNSLLLSAIRSVSVPTKNGHYVTYTKFEDCIDALYMIAPEEIKILGTILEKYVQAYTPHFAFVDTVCPHCGHKSKRVPIAIDYLVFLKYRLLLSTSVNVDSIRPS